MNPPMSVRASARPISARVSLRRQPFAPFGVAPLGVALVLSLAASARAQDAEPAAPAKPQRKLLEKDDLDEAGYLPGYRHYSGLGLSPYTPAVPGLPGGMTPGFSAPMPTQDWTFSYSGFMSASLEVSTAEREVPQEGQEKTVLHTLPVIIDEYNSFTSTNARPGNWVNMNFSYGNDVVSSSVSINTYNPTQPTNFWQVGSQYFINNAFLRFRVPQIEGFRVGWTVGYFTNNYGTLGQYGGGLYTHAITGGPQGVGETVVVERDIADGVTLVFEHGLMGNAGGKAPNDIVMGDGNEADPAWAASFTNHGHLGIVTGSTTQWQAQVHLMNTWSQDDRLQRNPLRNPPLTNNEFPADLPTTRELDESYVRDGRLTVAGFDAKMVSPTYGVLGVGVSYIDGYYSFPLRGITTFGGDPERLTNSWWGVNSAGTGTLLVGGISYTMSVARLILAPDPFSGRAPDIVITTGATFGRTTSSDLEFDKRVRHKYGVDALYTVLPWLGFGLRLDRVVPSSKNDRQTYHVVAPRILFKTDWGSRENITLGYVKWFFGPESHLDGLSQRSNELIDDEMFLLNFNMWF